MLESKNCYFPQNENKKPSKGYSATIVFENDYNVNRGCTGFKSKATATQWLKGQLARISNGSIYQGYTIKRAIVEII